MWIKINNNIYAQSYDEPIAVVDVTVLQAEIADLEASVASIQTEIDTLIADSQGLPQNIQNSVQNNIGSDLQPVLYNTQEELKKKKALLNEIYGNHI